MVVVVGGSERTFCALFNTCTQKVDGALAALSFFSVPISTRAGRLQLWPLEVRKRLGNRGGISKHKYSSLSQI